MREAPKIYIFSSLPLLPHVHKSLLDKHIRVGNRIIRNEYGNSRVLAEMWSVNDLPISLGEYLYEIPPSIQPNEFWRYTIPVQRVQHWNGRTLSLFVADCLERLVPVIRWCAPDRPELASLEPAIIGIRLRGEAPYFDQATLYNFGWYSDFCPQPGIRAIRAMGATLNSLMRRENIINWTMDTLESIAFGSLDPTTERFWQLRRLLGYIRGETLRWQEPKARIWES